MTSILFGMVLGLAAPTARISVEGEGYLRLVREGRIVYAKSATLTFADGSLCAEGGHPVVPAIGVSGSLTAITVDSAGNVSGTFESSPRLLGRLVLAVFPGPAPTPDSSGFLLAAERPTLKFPSEGAGSIKTSLARTAGVPSANPQPSSTRNPSNPNQVRSAGSLKREPGTSESARLVGEIPSVRANVTITVLPRSEVSGKQFTLGEIAEVSGENAEAILAVVVGESPALGVERGVDKIRIQGRLRSAGINPTGFSIQVPANAKIARKGQKVSAERFLAKATESAAMLVPSAEFKCAASLGEMVVPDGVVELLAERTTQNGSNVSVTVAVKVDGRRFNSRTLTLVAVAGANQVKSGSSVRIRVISHGAVVEVAGKTKGTANVGGTVEVITAATSQMPSATLTGVLKGAGVVEVKL